MSPSTKNAKKNVKKNVRLTETPKQDTEASENTKTFDTDTKTVAATPADTQTSHMGVTGRIARSWRQTQLLTKILIAFAVIGIVFLLFFAGAKRRFRKLLKLQGE